MDLGLSGRVALVCGASKGLGYACAEALADEGAALAIVARGFDALEEARTRLSARTTAKVTAHAGDLSKATDVERVAREAMAVHGHVDILVTNSGGPRPAAFDEADEAMWDHAHQVVLQSVVRLVRIVSPGMRERGWGRIVNITSSSYREPIVGLVLSNAFRPAVTGLAKTLSQELGPFGITVNNVAPGRFDTDRLREVAAARAQTAGGSVEAAMRDFGAQAPAGRIGSPRELGDVVAFLCSDRAGFVNGVTVPVDGGLSRAI